MSRKTMMKSTSIMMIAVIAAVMIAGALAVTMTTGQAFAHSNGKGGDTLVNDGSGGPGNSDFGHSHNDKTPTGDAAACHNRCGAHA